MCSSRKSIEVAPKASTPLIDGVEGDQLQGQVKYINQRSGSLWSNFNGGWEIRRKVRAPFLSEMNTFPVPCHVPLVTKSFSTNVTSVVSHLHMHQPLVSFQKITPLEGLSTLLTLVPERILQLHVCGLQSSPPLLLLTCGDGTRTISYWGSIPIIVVVFPDYLNLDA